MSFATLQSVNGLPANSPGDDPAAPSAELLSVPALTEKILRALNAAAPAEAVRALEYYGNSRPHPSAVMAPIVGQARQLSDVVPKLREHLRSHREHQALIAYLKALAAGSDVGFESPVHDPGEEAGEILRAILGDDSATFAALVRLVDASVAHWRGELAKLDVPAAIPLFDWLVCSGDPNHWVEVDKRKKVKEVLDWTIQSHASKLARIPELVERIERVGSARDRLEKAYLVRAGKAVDVAGGADQLAEALRESSRLVGSTASTDGAELMAGLLEDLAEVDGNLAKLGVDPASAPPAGLAARSAAQAKAKEGVDKAGDKAVGAVGGALENYQQQVREIRERAAKAQRGGPSQVIDSSSLANSIQSSVGRDDPAMKTVDELKKANEVLQKILNKPANALAILG
jgi:hypothetical protein